MGEIQGRFEATGRGVSFGLREFFRSPKDLKQTKLGGTLEGKKVIVQGLGNVGITQQKFFRKRMAQRLSAS